jgi:hypothetical protein
MAEFQWRAKWIWDSGDPAPENAYRIFRKTFTWPEDYSGETVARICADTRYRLYVNGYTLTNGPAPSAPGIYAYDEIDLKFSLKLDAENVITIVVNYVGTPMFFYQRNRGGLLFQMGDVISDETWLVAKQSPWIQDTPRLSVQQAFGEYYDSRNEPNGMFFGEIEPDEWLAATVVAQAEGGPWKALVSRDIPMPESYYDGNTLYQSGSVRHIEYGNCTPGEADTVAGQLTLETLRPLTRGNITWDRDTRDLVIEPDGEDVYVLFDFGREVSGFLDFDIDGADGIAGGNVDIAYDEGLRVGETPSGMRQDWGTNSNLRYADRLILADGFNNFQNYSPRAFRYIRLAFRNLKARAALTALGAYECTYPINWRGTFTCSDARLDKIWEIGRRTLQLCMDDRFMDCPWRERAQWVGDAKVEALGAAYCFGDTRLHARFLRQIAYSQHEDGRTDPVGPGEWDPWAPNHPIPGFTCIWIHSIWDYYMLTGDGELPKELLPNVYKALQWLNEYAKAEGGLLVDVPGWNFTDWVKGLDGGNEGIIAPVNLFAYRALQIAVEIARLAGDSENADHLAKSAARVADAFDRLFWNESRGVYVDRIVEGKQSEEASQHTNSLVLLYEIGSEERRKSALSHLLDDPSLLQIGSPYFSFYLLAALNKYGRHEEALDYIRSHWGPMMDAGATTWWEEYHGQSSRCHAWSIGPTIDLMTQVLGVTPDEPGFTSVRFAPKPCGLKWAKGIVPIPAGDVVANWQQDSERLLINVTVPTGVHLRPILPAGPKDRLVIDGEPVHEDSIVRRTETEAELAVLPGTGYRFEIMKEVIHS